MSIEYIPFDISTASIIGKCYDSLKDALLGRTPVNWVHFGILLAYMGVKTIDFICPICKHEFNTREGLYNHLKYGKCSNKFKAICIDVSNRYKNKIAVKTLKRYKYVIVGKRAVRVNIIGLGGFSCIHGDYVCVADNMMFYLKQMGLLKPEENVEKR